MAWNLEGTFYENCSCDAICPCTWSNMARPATNDDCRAALLFAIEKGDVNGVDVSATSVLMVIQTPPMMLEGNWKAGLVIDAAATEAQVEALSGVFSGALGGPPGALGPLVGEFLGVERLPVSVTSEGVGHHIVIGDAADCEPVQLTHIVVHPAGPTLDVAHGDDVTIDLFGIAWSGDGRSGFSNPFAWAA
jgi:hypothetical protein